METNYNEIRKLAHELLKESCRSAIERSRKTEGTYEFVKCSFKLPSEFFKSIKNNKKLYKEWLRLTERYLENGKNLAFRPTLDRIDEKGHYFIKNIQILTFSENASKARQKK